MSSLALTRRLDKIPFAVGLTLLLATVPHANGVLKIHFD
ncbi:hypothetical protein D1BOALGB6SA_3712 [Olavius sp. associated proteobacterium Delta 1]|nr:hypothetical protein D1BOALGB6SA_3712 [Olavius sp. associated proteobacterium Delta 1]